MASRRSILSGAGAIGALAMLRAAHAQNYPSRAMRWIVPFPAGGPSDVLARIVGQALSDRLGQPVVIENRPGASGNTGTQAVVNADPDGYTLLLVAAPNAINISLYPHLSFNFERDIVPVASIGRGALAMLVAPSLPVETVVQFIAYAKANAGKINLASAGNGTPPHVAGELFTAMAGIEVVHVPYRGVAPAITDLLSGRVQVLFDPLPSSIGYIRSGKLRALAVTTARRAELLPDVPALAETLEGYEASTWFGIGAPKGVPSEVIGRLNSTINAVLADPAVRARITGLGTDVLAGTPAEFAALIADEARKWAEVVKRAGIKPE
jgi:tripartite-type tricarboxylate transporter receptor subunit TctC